MISFGGDPKWRNDQWVFDVTSHQLDLPPHRPPQTKTLCLAVLLVTFLGWLSDLLERLSDLQLGHKKVTLNHLVNMFLQLYRFGLGASGNPTRIMLKKDQHDSMRRTRRLRRVFAFKSRVFARCRRYRCDSLMVGPPHLIRCYRFGPWFS